MVGFLLFILLGAGALFAFGLGIFWVLYQLNKSRNADLDAQIRRVAQDENKPLEQRLASLQSAQEAQHRETMTLLGEMEKRLPTRDSVSEHDSRIGRLESKASDQRAQIDALFERVRKIELRCAVHGADDTETLPVCGARA
jgi:predicted RNase H-like nuclease (RuvC/YqgF family)